MFMQDGYCGCNLNGGYPHGDDWRMVSVGATPIEVLGFTANGIPVVAGDDATTTLDVAKNAARSRRASSAGAFFMGALVLVGLGALIFSGPPRSSGRPATVGGARTTARRKGVVSSAVKKTRKKAAAKKTVARTPIYPSVSGRKPGKAKPAKAKTGKRTARAHS